ncbi:peptidase S8/S53 domain-containing protein [Mycena epipterygia]|nr:peptidase S8/S53 domain-containing protein [Mycena epipterygia]
MRFISTTSVVLSALLFTASARPQNFVPSTNATSFSIDQQVLEAVSLGQLVPANAPWDLARFAQKDKLQPGAAGMGTSETSRDWKFPICDLTPKQDVLIYVLDLGVRASHKEFGGRVLPGKDYEGGSDTSDSDGHGTAAAGCAAGATVGVSRWAKIVPIKVAPQRQLITPADVAEGLNNVLDHFVPLMSKVAGGIISISITTFRNVEIQGLFKQAMDKYGMHIVTAAGNQDKDQCAEWAENVGQINVGATDIQDHRAKFPTGGEPGSNFGPCVDIYAPGRSIQTASYTSDTAIELQHGTSFAAPQVAGIIANKISACMM